MFNFEDIPANVNPLAIGRPKSSVRQAIEALPVGKMFRVPVSAIDSYSLRNAASNAGKATGLKYAIRKTGDEYLVCAAERD